MNRPFIFNRKQYDGDSMFLDLRRKRLQILAVCPQLHESAELMMFMQPEGELTDVRRMAPEDLALGEHEHLWHSDNGD